LKAEARDRRSFGLARDFKCLLDCLRIRQSLIALRCAGG